MYPVVAGYTPLSDVSQHALIDLDQKDFESFLADPADFAGALDIYENGKNSRKTDSFRTLQGFADTDAAAKFNNLNEELFKTYQAYWDNVGDFADKFVLDALKGQGMFADTEDVFRRECAQKGSAYRNTWMYVVHEMEDAIIDCNNGSPDDNDAGVKAWDEAWVFYAGSLEGVDGTGSGKQPYSLAEKRCANFGTCASAAGRAKVNNELLGLFKDGQSLLEARDCAGADEKKRDIIELMAVPLIQGTLRYAYRLDGKTSEERVSMAKEIAEGLTFAAAVLPVVDQASPDAAKVIREQMYDLEDEPVVNFKEVREAFESAYKALGINCGDVGALTAEETGDNEALEVCIDTAAGLSASALLVAATAMAAVFSQ